MSERVALLLVIGMVIAVGLGYPIARPWLIQWSSKEKPKRQGFEIKVTTGEPAEHEKERD